MTWKRFVNGHRAVFEDSTPALAGRDHAPAFRCNSTLDKTAAQNKYLQETSKSILQFNTDEQIRKEKDRMIAEKNHIISILKVQIEKLTAEKEKFSSIHLSCSAIIL